MVYIVKTGPVWALATTRSRKWSRHTYTSPLMAPVKVRLVFRGGSGRIRDQIMTRDWVTLLKNNEVGVEQKEGIPWG